MMDSSDSDTSLGNGDESDIESLSSKLRDTHILGTTRQKPGEREEQEDTNGHKEPTPTNEPLSDHESDEEEVKSKPTGAGAALETAEHEPIDEETLHTADPSQGTVTIYRCTPSTSFINANQQELELL